MYRDSYPIPNLFIPSLYYSLLFNSKILVSFFYCMHACTVTRCTIVMVVLIPKIGFSTWTIIPMNKHSPIMYKCISPLLIENTVVVCMKSTLFTYSNVQKYLPLKYVLFTIILTLECMLAPSNPRGV